MKVAVMGAGGIGAYLGAMLARAGNEVTLVCRGANLQAIRANGLKLVRHAETDTIRNLTATDDPSGVGPVDVVLQCAKLYDLAATTRLALPMIGPGTMVVPVQNGVVAHEEIGAVAGAAHALAGMVFLSSHLSAPGEVTQRSPSDRIVFGEPGGGVSARAGAFRDALVEAGVEAVASDYILGDIWSKFVAQAGTASIACLSRQPVGELCARPGLLAAMTLAMREAEAVGRALGVRLLEGVVDKGIAFNRSVRPSTRISMLEDLEAGKPLELEWSSGYLVREGRRLGIPVPTHELAYACLGPHAAGRRAAA